MMKNAWQQQRQPQNRRVRVKWTLLAVTLFKLSVLLRYIYVSAIMQCYYACALFFAIFEIFRRSYPVLSIVSEEKIRTRSKIKHIAKWLIWCELCSMHGHAREVNPNKQQEKWQKYISKIMFDDLFSTYSCFDLGARWKDKQFHFRRSTISIG